MWASTRFGLVGSAVAMMVAATTAQANEGASGTPTRGFVCDDAATTRTPTTADEQRAMTPEQALTALREGNRRWVAGETCYQDLRPAVAQASVGQHPFAAVLSCLDSRVPVELAFDQDLGDVFVGRVAGNVIDATMLGSFEFATAAAGAKLVVVMGHTSCGAVKGACGGGAGGNLGELLARIQPSVHAVTEAGTSCDATDDAHVNHITTHHVERTVQEIRDRSTVLRDMEQRGEIRIVGAMYDLATGLVTFLEEPTQASATP